ncbi:hypothetical protein PR202_ga00486 [Eleusine coracana subsp. coracana]|uniref:Uncharacterized protein n=1 Tax=Eleusine coracana subsp. coracana TaxID=191504 RepID=A0AAV5BD29_ELECO|nr:hypothetical protein PR202_ga00486 [Eleusine coracana subsp. coracana]
MEGRKRRGRFRNSIRRMAMECLCSGEQLKGQDETFRSSDSTITKDFSASGYSSRNGEIEQYLDNGNIEEAELSLREGVSLNYEEARALLGRLEYQRGHVEAALRVFDGIDISTLVPKMKISISRKADRKKTRSQWDSPPMPLHAVSLLMEAIYLKARALHDLGKFKGKLTPLAKQFEELLPSVLDKREWLYNVALCYLAEEDDLSALNLIRRILKSGEDSDNLKELLLASETCVEMNAATEGASYARRAIANMQGGCKEMAGVADLLLGVALSSQARSAISDTDRASWQCEALEVLGNAEKKMHTKDSRLMYSLSIENAEQRKLDTAAFYAKKLVKLEAGSELRSWLLLARILSAQKQFADAETIVDAALDQTGKWCQGDLLRTKARIHAAQGQFGDAVESYTQLLAIIQLRAKSFSAGNYLGKVNKDDKSLEAETWYDLALLYLDMGQWRDAEVCVSKIRTTSTYCALAWHATGKICEAKGLTKEALGAFSRAIDHDPKHVPSLISTAIVLRKLGDRPLHSVRCFLTDALQLDRTNHVAWFNLGLLYKEEGGRTVSEAAECFQAAALLEETAPVEPFR